MVYDRLTSSKKWSHRYQLRKQKITSLKYVNGSCIGTILTCKYPIKTPLRSVDAVLSLGYTQPV